MEGSDVLLAVAEVSIAFAGFTSIVGVLGHRVGEGWGAEYRLRLWLMIESSLATLFFSLLPFIPFHFAFDETVVWASASSSMAIFLFVHLAVVGARLRVLYRLGQWSTQRFESLNGGLILLTMVVQSMNALAIGFDRSFGPYLLGLILLLALASMHFVALLVAVYSLAPDDERGPSDDDRGESDMRP